MGVGAARRDGWCVCVARPNGRVLAFLMPDRIVIPQVHRITAVALHLGVFQGIVFFLREALW